MKWPRHQGKIFFNIMSGYSFCLFSTVILRRVYNLPAHIYCCTAKNDSCTLVWILHEIHFQKQPSKLNKKAETAGENYIKRRSSDIKQIAYAFNASNKGGSLQHHSYSPPTTIGACTQLDLYNGEVEDQNKWTCFFLLSNYFLCASSYGHQLDNWSETDLQTQEDVGTRKQQQH